MKILILTAFHRRPQISQLYWMGIKRLRKKFDIQVCSVVSDDENKTMAKFYNSEHIVETENKPFGRKLNTAMTEIINKDFDFLMQLGSDNLISNNAMETNLQYMNQYKLFGHTNIIIVCSKTKEVKVKNYGNVFGAGRCIAKDILLKSIPLWTDDKERGMDVDSEIRIEERTGFFPMPINDTEIIDVKSEENIWKFESLQGMKSDLNILTGKITTKEKDYLLAL